VEVLEDNVGYVLLNTFSPLTTEAALFEAFTELSQANVTDLVLDLRYNGGGLLAVASQLGYMIAGDVQTNVCLPLIWNVSIFCLHPAHVQPVNPS